MNIKKFSTLAGLIIFTLVLNGCANSNFNKKYNKPFKHNTPLIKDKNVVADGKYVPEWMYDNACKNGHDMLHEQKQYENQRVKDLENKLDTIKRITNYGETE